MVNLRLQKRLAASVLKCGRRKIWLDPNEKNEIGMGSTRASVRKLIRDGYIIKKPQKIHSRFRARQWAVSKRKGRHLGKGRRKGTRNARNPVYILWMKKQRAYRRLLRRYREAKKIDVHMYHRLYLKAKGNAFKNRANLIETIDTELSDKKRNAALMEQYRARALEVKRRREERDARRKKHLDEQLKLAEQAEKLVQESRQQARAAAAPRRPRRAKKVAAPKSGAAEAAPESGAKGAKGKGAKGKGKGKGGKGKGGQGQGGQGPSDDQGGQGGAGGRRRRKGKKGE